MARPDEERQSRPERVVLLDADNPMVEIHGRIVWQEEHDRVVEETWREAYAEGYDDDRRDMASQPLRIEFRRRRSFVHRVRMIILMIGILIVLLMLPVVIQNALR